MNNHVSRRSALGRLAGTAAALSVVGNFSPRAKADEQTAPAKLKGNIRHSASRWCYASIEMEQFCKVSREIGLEAIDLLDLKDIPGLKKHGLICSMVSGTPGGIASGLNRVENHDKIVEWMEKAIPESANLGAPNVICFSGNRAGLDDEKGLENCAIGLKRIAPIAEKHKINVCMELLNSKHNHKDYQCDHTAWGVELARRVGSERFKLLYDIYHMQIMEGDLIYTIKSSAQYIGHYHTGGVPGRGEIDETQEINYPAVMKAIVETGFKGFVGQEFAPKRDKIESLRQAIRICDV